MDQELYVSFLEEKYKTKVSQAEYWRQKCHYAVERLREVEAENAKLKTLLATKKKSKVKK